MVLSAQSTTEDYIRAKRERESERERGRERKRKRERERERECVCVCEREREEIKQICIQRRKTDCVKTSNRFNV